MWHDSMMNWGWGGGPFALFHLLWWGVVGVGVALLIRFLIRSERQRPPPEPDRALSLLRERYARGEIEQAEFEARKRDLS